MWIDKRWSCSFAIQEDAINPPWRQLNPQPEASTRAEQVTGKEKDWPAE
jgi:hypothetical protein